MKEKFRSNKFCPEKKAMLWHIESIVNEYMRQGIKLTLRQLYYQLVTKNLIANTESEYKKIGVLLADARYNGLIDWEAIEDRQRVPKRHSQFDDVLDLVKCAEASYRLDRWKGQKFYVELFTEKDALTSVLRPIADKWHIFFGANKGYSSATAMYDTAERINDAIEADMLHDPNKNKKKAILLYLGDHDPSGLDMVRDIKERIIEFLLGDMTEDDEDFKESRREYIESRFEVIHIALTMEQVRKYKPPPNPAKITDPRATMYIANYGQRSWEVDALKPDVMIKLVEDAIKEYVDVDKMNLIINQEKKDMVHLKKFAKKLQGVKSK